jgi:hypothetical protein
MNFCAAILQVLTPFFRGWGAACRDVWGVEKKSVFLVCFLEPGKLPADKALGYDRT